MMFPKTWRTLLPACVLLLVVSGAAANDDDDAVAPGKAGLPTLTAGQQHAVGVVVAQPVAGQAPARVAALGQVLDPGALIQDVGEMSAAEHADRAAAAELRRVQGLFSAGAGASQKMLESAQAEQAKAHAEAQSALARFTLRWGPVAALAPVARQKLIDDCLRGHSLLVRVNLPGQHSLGELPHQALLNLDGAEIPARVLGALRQSAEVQGAGLLVEAEAAPAGVAAGAILPVALLTTQHKGMILPREALLYDENGAYVYKELRGKQRTPATSTSGTSGPGNANPDGAADGKAQFAPVKVTLVMPYGEGWLVQGVDDDDLIVVRGAGVLWSMQGVGSRPADEDDD